MSRPPRLDKAGCRFAAIHHPPDGGFAGGSVVESPPEHRLQAREIASPARLASAVLAVVPTDPNTFAFLETLHRLTNFVDYSCDLMSRYPRVEMPGSRFSLVSTWLWQ